MKTSVFAAATLLAVTMSFAPAEAGRKHTSHHGRTKHHRGMIFVFHGGHHNNSVCFREKTSHYDAKSGNVYVRYARVCN